MQALGSKLRSQLERTVIAARDVAEEGAWAALERLAVNKANKAEALSSLSTEQRDLRVKLRAKGRQLGDVLQKNGEQEVYHLHRECAYEQWHQMLFARFLAENQLLMHPDGVPVSLEECEELAADEGTDGWTLAARYASRMLPQIFRADDPLLQVAYAPEDKQAMEKLLAGLPAEVFTAGDSLGWCYQFWQSKEKERVNKSGNKIGADELPAVTQLFTEDYMVDFLLDNTLGAWWAGKKLHHGDAEGTEKEEELREKVALPGVEWKYLRFIQGKDGKWTPAAGRFDGWPKRAKELKCLDPCMGSGHFVVAMFERLVALRMAEEKLDEAAAVAAVIRDNLFGLEIDPRCTQIGAFNLALAAWRRVGHCKLPAMNLACSGLAPNTREADWLAMVDAASSRISEEQRQDAAATLRLRNGMERLYRLFQKAAVLGSLINPRAGQRDLLVAAFHELQPLLEKALAQETKDDTAHEMAVTARGLAKAAEILAGQFTLVATNVPYLGRKKQDEVLMDYCERVHPDAKADLATCFVERCLSFCADRATTALVTPQNWLFLGGYKTLRQRALEEYEWGCVARLGARAFETIGGEIVNVSLVSLSRLSPAKAHRFASIDVSEEKTPSEKDGALLKESLTVLTQSDQLRNPDARISAKEHDSEMSPLGDYTECYQGAVTGDLERFRVQFWEIRDTKKTWQPFRTTIDAPNTFDGLNASIKWQEGSGELHEYAAATRDQLHDMHESGNRAWNRLGVAINRMGDLFASAYLGEIFDNNVAVVIPKKKHDLPALLAFCSSPDFSDLVRSLDQTIKVTNRTLIKVPFDLAHWQKVAAEKYPHGLPEPESDDPTQWLFHGHPGGRVEAASRRLEGTRQDAASTFGFLDREAEIENLSGNLPHWRQEGVTYFVTFRTHDSIPQAKMQEWLAEREAWLKAHPEPHDAATRREYGRRFPGRFHEWLDAGYGACVLARPDCRAIVEGALRHFAGQRYALDEFVVMPNHVHVLVTPLAGHSLSAILHSWKSYTSKEIGKVLGKSGTFWQKESFDHILRSPEQLGKVRQYICGNPKGRVEAASRRLDQATQATRQDAASTLQVGVARLLAYRWPAELDEKMRLSKRARALVKQCDELLPFADADGIVCIPAVAGERTAADRLLALLSARGVKPDRNLDDWLRDKFFEEHCQLFHQRPFVWHIWDGRKKDGFHALVNYHQLDRKRLEKLIYTHLGDWIARQRAAESRSESGAEARHLAAEDLQERLKLILEGEPPYDIFVRWKPLEEQPIGWDPDVNDGVRINIRPFVTAGVLRKNPKIKWKKDRGKEPDRPKDQYPWFWGWDEETEDFMGGPEFDGNRWNDCHYSNEAKRAARAAKGKSKR